MQKTEKWRNEQFGKWLKIHDLETAALKTLQIHPASAPACTVCKVCLNLFDLKDENANKRAASNKHDSIKLVSAYQNRELICNQMRQKVSPGQ